LLMYWEQYISSSNIKFNKSDTHWTARPHTINFFSKTITQLGNLATCVPWSVSSSMFVLPPIPLIRHIHKWPLQSETIICKAYEIWDKTTEF
jgi:hypothetical protein